MTTSAAKYDIPFCSNDNTDMQCFPATICMMLNALMPERHFTLDDTVKMAGAVPGKSVWPARMLIELHKLGLVTVMVEGFDAKRFVREGADYLRDAFGDETADWQVNNTADLAKEQRDYQELLNIGGMVENRIPELSDIREYLDDGWLVKCTVNSRRLNRKPGYVGHTVVVLSISDDEVVLHNPGLPPVPNQRVPLADFEAAWAYPNDEAKELIAIRSKGEA